MPIGALGSIDVGNLNNQVRGVRISGSLNIDCADIVDYGLYCRLLCAESVLGEFYPSNANKWGAVLISCWYFNIGDIHAISCAQGVSLGYATEGESGLLDINATFIPSVKAWSTIKSKGKGYTPLSDDPKIYTVGAGVVLGKSLSTGIGTVCAEHTQGAGVVTMNAIAWSIGSMYLEANSKDFTQVGEPNVGLLSSNRNVEGHTLPITTLHLSATCGILIRDTSSERVDINSIYRYDNAKTMHSLSKSKSIKIENSNYYTLLGHGYSAPPSLITLPLNVDFIRSGLHFSTWDVNTQIGAFIGSGTNQNIAINVNKLPTGLIIKIESDDGFEQFSVTATTTKYTLTKPRTQGKFYGISIGQISSASDTIGTVCVRSKKGDWFYW
ncbi:Uncharacterised protein [Providencia rustigianii]|nr:Uncharacterised protein [Providencia rustigianii]